ncbi:toll/interleukin-1 receptor domain-containing protein [Bacteroides ovatus]|uniref:toll/interleukin-1 receptor domain-containing protein n=1 Tax=Bacteroides ovatus TaxID=28116 RepID=UPI00202E8380|nr:toll/interleukin-1 receptor domain-containing protein [Bacteroides ovatus]MCM1723310.1 toll/interleukin-1 receptor domain-containing protein [Bacteroides ovatus]MCM1758466.1 toll/interleukin-1 receptor domain-containing protein [Bacteroides ovatus]MCM1868963.1 toll/interleukin-1 receptor domain-containing protein [Bacteroides ovatus]MCM1911793.1 toll/interleukin-1 receptor domain-containing protein [Bacteroides ovatus]
MSYDIFISCKSEDYGLAHEVYQFFTDHGFSVFIADEELKKLGIADYGRVIDDAIEQSHHMIVIASNVRFVEMKTSSYVYYEWHTFSEEIKSGRKSGNLMTIITDQVQIAELPIALWNSQTFPFDNYRNILNYIRHDTITDDSISVDEKEKVNPVNDLRQEVKDDTTIYEDNIFLSEDDLVPSNFSYEVSITDTKTPIAILVGAPAVGKTMTLIRLSRYLQEQAIQVRPIESFRSASDRTYKELCIKFLLQISSTETASGTSLSDFLLTEVTNRGQRVLQIFDAPGEIFSMTDSDSQYPPYFNKLITAPNKRIWIVVIELNWRNIEDRLRFVEQIARLRCHMHPSDRVVILVNKIDQTMLVYGRDTVDHDRLIFEIRNCYPGLLSRFANQNPVSKLFRKYNCDILAFQTGTYFSSPNGELIYTPSASPYPCRLWNILRRNTK